LVKKVDQRVKRALRILLVRGRSRPGIRGSELRKLLGIDYPEVLKKLNSELEKLGLRVKAVLEDGSEVNLDEREKLSQAWIGIVLTEELKIEDLRSVGWRIDDLAVLASTLVLVFAHGGKVQRQTVVNFLKDKVPEWRIQSTLDRFIKAGYLIEDEEFLISLGWRTYMEVDLEKLVKMLGADAE